MTFKRCARKRSLHPTSDDIAAAKRKVVARRLLQEREFPFTASHDFYTIASETYHLDKLMQAKTEGNLQVVREFYAPASILYIWTFKVRGVPIDFASDSFREFLQLPYVTNCKYRYFQQHEDQIPMEDISKLLDYKGEVSWQSPADKQVYLPRNRLSIEARIWMHFVKDYFWPSTNKSKLTKDQALVIYLLMRKEEVDVGDLIYNSLQTYAHDHSYGLMLPHLIAAFCKEKGVPDAETDTHFHPPLPFKYKRFQLPEQPPQTQTHGSPIRPDPLRSHPPQHQPSYSELMAMLQEMNGKIDQCLLALHSQDERLQKIETFIAHQSQKDSQDESMEEEEEEEEEAEDDEDYNASEPSD